MQPFSFSQPQAQPQGFGGGGTSSFGGFGGGGFGQPTTSQSTGGFGSTSFGAATSTATPAFGGGSAFGTSSGFGSGTQPFATGGTSTTNLFGGTAQQTSGFGSGAPPAFGSTPQTSTTSGFGTQTSGFGSSGFGTGGGSLFGSTQPQTSSTGFGTQQSTFGGTQQTSGFGTTQGVSSFAAAQPSLFGSTQPTSFGFGATSQPSTFGTATTQSGSWFGAGQPQTSTFSSFGGGGSLFGQQKTGFSFPSFSSGQPQQQTQQQQQQQQQQLQQQQLAEEQHALHLSIFGVCKFGDERDGILANLNYVQAAWGAGKGYFSQTSAPVIYTEKNAIYRFRAVGYSFMYNDTNEDGQVVIHIKKPHSKVSDEEAQLITSLQNIIAKPNILYKVTASKAMDEDVTVLILTADDRTSLRRIPATDLASALMQPQVKQQLDNLGIVLVCPKVKPSPEQLRAYLDTPPAGVDPRVWKIAQDDNPDPNQMIPIPLLGARALKNRIEAQQKETNQHLERLRLIADEISSLHNRHSNMDAEIRQTKSRTQLIKHRLVSAFLRTLLYERQGIPVQPEEEDLRKQVEVLDKEFNSPNQYRSRLNEIMSHIRLQKMALEGRGASRYAIDQPTLDKIKEFLSVQQGSIIQLVDTLKVCMEFTNKMNQDMVNIDEKNPRQ